MTPEDVPQFDDPALKAAVCRVLGGEKAPESLRQRVAAQMAQRQMPEARAWRMRLLPREPRILAAAAIALIAIGFAAYRIYDLYNPIGVKSQYAATTLPKELA